MMANELIASRHALCRSDGQKQGGKKEDPRMEFPPRKSASYMPASMYHFRSIFKAWQLVSLWHFVSFCSTIHASISVLGNSQHPSSIILHYSNLRMSYSDAKFFLILHHLLKIWQLQLTSLKYWDRTELALGVYDIPQMY